MEETINMIKKLLLVSLILLCSTHLLAAPAPTGSSGTWTHGGSVTITGADFGSKSPAGPLVWDDCEDPSDGTYVTTSYPGNSISRVDYSQIEPPSTLSSTHRMRYRATPYTPTGNSTLTAVSSPHANSSQIVSFGHENGVGVDGNDGANGWVTIPNTDGAGHGSDTWYVSYYHRYVEEWPAALNNKFFVFNNSGDVWGSSNGFHYWDYNKMLPGNPSYDYCRITPMTSTYTVEDDGNPPLTLPDNTSPWGKDQTINANVQFPKDPQDGWQKYETIVTNSSIKFLADNNVGWWGTNIPDWIGGTNADVSGEGANSVSIGGYFYQSTSPNVENDDAHRMFDDIYVDDTLSRVILGDADTYAACTILEPQPPTAWTDNGGTGDEIEVTVNLGNLSGDTAYVYVFDSDGDYNTTGYAITIDGDGTTPTTISVGGSGSISFGGAN